MTTRTTVPPRGLTLIELLVAIALGMLLTMAISGVLVRQEGARRALTATNDVLLNGAHVTHQVDRLLRSAGSGFSQAWQSAYGCQLTAARAGVQLLPRGSDWPAPFANFSRSPRLVPVLVHAGAGTGGTDVLAVASGNSGLGEAPLRMLAGSATANAVRVPATVGLRQRDLVLLAEQGRAECMLQQAAAGFAGGASQQIDFGADYGAATIGTLNLADFGSVGEVSVLPVGNTTGNPPAFQLLGIDADRALVALDMLRLAGGAGDPINPLADGVIELRARYGIDVNDDRIVDQWVDPAVTPWTAAELTDGSVAAQANLYRILAVRVGMVLRTATAERQDVSGASLVLFQDLAPALRHTRTLSAGEQRFRYRLLEFTVPLRNVMLI
jgi:type IV pilus assembly protein PilW